VNRPDNSQRLEEPHKFHRVHPISHVSKIATSVAPAPAATPTHLNVFNVEEYESNGKTSKRWTKIGAAFPHKEGTGFSIELRAFLLDGRLVVLPPDTGSDDSRNNK